MFMKFQSIINDKIIICCKNYTHMLEVIVNQFSKKMQIMTLRNVYCDIIKTPASNRYL